MVGVEVPSSGKNLEIKPYAIAGLGTDLASRPPVENDLDRNWGFDAKAGLTRNLTADFTYHTAFAQVEADEQQINLTRFNLLFPEKREFFLEGQGMFGFGGGGADAPVVFFSRRIGLESGRPVPIKGGARLTGRVGKYSIGALHTATGDDARVQARATNFSVVRLRRDVFRRSAIGLIATERSRSTVSSGSNAAYGVDGIFSFYDNVNVTSYLARTQTPGLRGQDASYRTQLDYNADRYGLQLERLVVGEHFNPEVGFVRRENFKQNYAQVRFSPRPGRDGPFRAVRRFSWSSHYEYTTSADNRLETRELEFGPFSTQFQSSDSIGIAFTRIYELIERPFSIARDAIIPPGGYEYFNIRNMNTLGQHRRISGTIEFQRGSLYNGDRTTLGFRNGRMKITPQLALEPGVSVTWIDLPAGSFTTTLASTRATYTVSPRMFVAALVQYNSTTASLSTNVRMRWEYQPGSEVFIVYTEGRETLTRGAGNLQNRGVVVKANRLFRF